MSTDEPQYFEAKGIDYTVEFKMQFGQNAAYLMGIGLRDISGWYEQPWKVRQRKLSGTKGRFLDMGGASGRREKRMNESRAGKKNRMSAWRSRICYKGVYMPREPKVTQLQKFKGSDAPIPFDVGMTNRVRINVSR